MNPRLFAVTGPRRERTFVLADADFLIGREASNNLFLDDHRVSRKHCLIRREGERFRLKDLDSRNGTFVNDIKVDERLLQPGDKIEIGKSEFVFLVDEMTAIAPESTVDLDESELEAGSTLSLKTTDSVYLRSSQTPDGVPLAARWARDLHTLFQISMAISSIRSLEALERKLLELIFEVLPAERGAILVTGENPERFASAFFIDRHSNVQPFPVSRTIVQEVLREHAAILENEVMRSKAFSGAESLIFFRIESLLCVPLMVLEKALGVIYLDTKDRAVRFNDGHLQLMTAVATIAAVAIRNVMHLEWLECENMRLQENIDIEHDMVGESARLRDVHQFIAKVAPLESTVLITGESGTGKELVARAIHRNSPRAAKPFVAINCAVLSEALLESELFGHERGAFTDAYAQKKGKLEVADGGTVFLDEMGELAPAIQAKLLRVLQEHEFERVGGTRPIKVSIRVIAATNRNLEEEIKAGLFRQDLYYRLNVVSLRMPPLRQRREDIPLLAGHFARKYADKSKRQVHGITAEAQACLLAYDWPGNVRELENAIERAVVLGSTDLILAEDLPEAILDAQPPAESASLEYHQALREGKRQIILRALDQAKGEYSEAARLLGLHVNNLHRLIRTLDLKHAAKKER